MNVGKKVILKKKPLNFHFIAPIKLDTKIQKR